mmetsp:Transcript_23639/g.68052  ORF Transcript_23639/g.68052 Transcript_23639/m.68052 type:complete len:219 (+) Transcript_23639:1552-2208(+)
MYNCSRCCPRVCNVDAPTCSESAQRACDSNSSRSDSRMAWSVAVSVPARAALLSIPTQPCSRSVLSNVGARYPLLALISATRVPLAAAAAFLADPPPNNSFRSFPRPSPILLLDRVLLVGALVVGALVMEEVLPVRLASRARATSSAKGLTSCSIRRFDSCTLAASPSTSAKPCMAVAHLRASRSSRSDSCSVEVDRVEERNARTRDRLVSYSTSKSS